MKKPNILTIAGYDPSGGAGVLGDIKAIEASGGYGMGVITTHTIQATYKVIDSQKVDVELFEKQLDTLLLEEKIHGLKVGLVGNTTNCLYKAIDEIKYVVFDPIICSSSGYRFIEPPEIKMLIKTVYPKITLLTPNFLEAELLLGEKITKEKIEKQLITLSEKCQCNVLLKGGHSFTKGQDILYDGKKIICFEPKNILGKEAHGTGCALSSAIVTYLAKGENLEASVVKGKEIVYRGLEVSEEGKLNYGIKVKV